VIKRTRGDDPKYSYYISNAPVSTRLKTFVWLSDIRWAIEQCFEQAKDELGMGHYEVRKYPGWNHHMLTCTLAHFFLWDLRIRLGKKALAIALSQLITLLVTVLPLKIFDIHTALNLIRWIQRKNHLAFLSHRKARPRAAPSLRDLRKRGGLRCDEMAFPTGN
jgi:hypothetical protein